jgi:hypothetical protein
LAAHAYSRLALDEEPVDLGSITVFKTPQLSGQQAIEGIGDLHCLNRFVRSYVIMQPKSYKNSFKLTWAHIKISNLLLS